MGFFHGWLEKEEEHSTRIRRRRMFGLGFTHGGRSIYDGSHQIEASKILYKLLKEMIYIILEWSC